MNDFHRMILLLIVVLDNHRSILNYLMNDKYRDHTNDKHRLAIVYVLLREFLNVDSNFDIVVSIYIEQ